MLCYVPLSRDTEPQAGSPARELSSTPLRPGTVLCERYRVVRKIGSGGMSDIYEALDLHREALPIAVKLMRATGPKAMVRLKREYRRMARLSHRNLVKYDSLEEHGGRPFIAMELIAGLEFYQALQEVPRPKLLGRLRELLQQLTYGVMYLHHAGRVHRDLKGSNVMLDSDGRLVILDFGLVDDVGRRTSITGSFGGVVGTLMYMSPEQSSGHLSRPPSDWYAVGVMLYRCLAGKYPFSGTNPFSILNTKMQGEVPRVRKVAPWVPVALDDLISRLLHQDPARRATGQDILAWCSIGDLPGRRRSLTPPPLPTQKLVGRGAELKLLLDVSKRFAARPEFTKLMLSGPAGVGKSALLRAFLAPLRRDHRFVVLKGYCYESDNVAFNAVDHLIERLGVFLRRQTESMRKGLLGDDFRALTYVFPTLRQVSDSYAGDGILQSLGLETIVSPHERRHRAFAALRGLLHRIAAGKRLILAIEDLQWGDLDSVQLLDSVLRAPGAPPLMFVGTYRDEHIFHSQVLQSIEQSGSAANEHHICLSSFSLTDSVELARRLLKVPASSQRVQLIAKQSGGNPLVIEEMSQSPDWIKSGGTAKSTHLLDRLVEYHLRNLDEECRWLVEVVAVAGRPMTLAVAGHAARVENVTQRHVLKLRANRLLRVVTLKRGPSLEVFNDRVRDVTARRMSDDEVAKTHRGIAEALLRHGTDSDELLAHHWYHAGQLERAYEAATTAAESLLRGGITDSAGRLLKLARLCSPHDRALRMQLARTLIEGGRSDEAAPLLLEAAVDSKSPKLRRRYRIEAGEHFLRAGSVSRGVEVLRPLFRDFGVEFPSSERRASDSLDEALARLTNRKISWAERSRAEISSQEQERYALLWTLAQGLFLHEPTLGGLFAVRSALAALELGRTLDVCRSLALSGIVAIERGQRVALEWFETIEDAAEAISDTSGTSFISVCLGSAHLRLGDLVRAHEFLEQGLRQLPLNAHWEHGVGGEALLDTLKKLGEVGELANRSRVVAQRARDVGNQRLYRVALLSTAWSALVTDAPDAARLHLDEVSRMEEGRAIRDLRLVSAELDYALYCGDAGKGWIGVSTWWIEFERSALPMRPKVRRQALLLRARAALACCADPRARNPAVRRIAEQDLKFLTEGPEVLGSEVYLLRASFEALHGDKLAAKQALNRAVAGFDASAMVLLATLGRYALALTKPDDLDTAQRYLQLQGVSRPDLLLDVVAPGLRQSSRGAGDAS